MSSEELYLRSFAYHPIPCECAPRALCGKSACMKLHTLTWHFCVMLLVAGTCVYFSHLQPLGSQASRRIRNTIKSRHVIRQILPFPPTNSTKIAARDSPNFAILANQLDENRDLRSFSWTGTRPIRAMLSRQWRIRRERLVRVQSSVKPR